MSGLSVHCHNTENSTIFHAATAAIRKYLQPAFTGSILFYPITLEGRRGTTDEFATIPFHLVLFSAGEVKTD